jgi:glutaredoxin-like protein
MELARLSITSFAKENFRALLNESVRQEVQTDLKSLQEKVKLIVFTQKIECSTCAQNTQLSKELASLSDLIDLEIYNFLVHKEKAEQYRVDKIPAMVVEGKKDYGIRFYGIPAGYEFSSLLEAIKMVSAETPGLSAKSLEDLSQLDRPVPIQVFVTPT